VKNSCFCNAIPKVIGITGRRQASEPQRATTNYVIGVNESSQQCRVFKYEGYIFIHVTRITAYLDFYWFYSLMFLDMLDKFLRADSFFIDMKAC